MNNVTIPLPKIIAVLALACLMGAVYAEEHPAEHPSAGHGHSEAEHKQEHPSTAGTGISKENLAHAIEDYVTKDAALKGGYYLVYDSLEKKTLTLTLDKVHKERLSKVGEDTYFACADFKTLKGEVYDLDIFLQGPDAEQLTVTEVTIHKEGGKPRYTWHEKDGIWMKKPAK